MRSFLCFCLGVGAVACWNLLVINKPHTGYTPAPPVYMLLAQQALTYQMEGDASRWASLLADSVQYFPPESRGSWRPRSACRDQWQCWWQTRQIRHVRLRQFTHLPLDSRVPFALWQQPGVCVATYCVAEVERTDGRRQTLRLSVCCHFNPDRLLDGYLLTWQPLPA